jgi:hypothetical protein
MSEEETKIELEAVFAEEEETPKKRGPKPKVKVEETSEDPVDVVIAKLMATPGGSNIARHVERLLK